MRGSETPISYSLVCVYYYAVYGVGTNWGLVADGAVVDEVVGEVPG